MLNKTLTGLGPWAARIALIAWLVQVEDPFRLAGCVLVLAAQVPLQRSIWSWGLARAR